MYQLLKPSDIGCSRPSVRSSVADSALLLTVLVQAGGTHQQVFLHFSCQSWRVKPAIGGAFAMDGRMSQTSMLFILYRYAAPLPDPPSFGRGDCSFHTPCRTIIVTMAGTYLTVRNKLETSRDGFLGATPSIQSLGKSARKPNILSNSALSRRYRSHVHLDQCDQRAFTQRFHSRTALGNHVNVP